MTKRKPKPKSDRLFLFTPDDEAQIAVAKFGAMRFFKNYGKGRDPYEIDHSHYYKGINQTKQWKTNQDTE